MSEIINYKVEFVRRTEKLLNESYNDFKSKDLEVTFLLNCLLGLIVSVTENEKKSRQSFKGDIDDDFISLIPDNVGFIINKLHSKSLVDKRVKKINSKIGHKSDLSSFSKLWFINKLRNGIAHQHIEPINKYGKWVGVKLWNEYKNERDFEIHLTIKQLRALALKIADIYLRENESEK